MSKPTYRCQHLIILHFVAFAYKRQKRTKTYNKLISCSAESSFDILVGCWWHSPTLPSEGERKETERLHCGTMCVSLQWLSNYEYYELWLMLKHPQIIYKIRGKTNNSMLYNQYDNILGTKKWPVLGTKIYTRYSTFPTVRPPKFDKCGGQSREKNT